MKKLRLRKDELWPWYTLDDEEFAPSYAHVLECPEGLYEEYLAANEEFFRIQEIIEELAHETD